jgi:hypothetical protein
MTSRRFSPPWTIEETAACFIVRDYDARWMAALIEATSPDRTIGEARTRYLPLLSRRPPYYLRR